ncbi:MFS transporter [Sphaerisporangium siamense]|uniref:Putative MFS family arabinose efflux permease n=1 Tax=Sphaerisporangium siamense TaxID=795645 RepID=A0A7W7D3J9_9ACTN|nr:MFS transporter [Sphaerisporangium siamense]MBB4699674.1 putative MFS family arabinose efflux permease [Sphaerisporangium siamense]GII87852.1 MFS transporter [Sphaerisporangium siamense]
MIPEEDVARRARRRSLTALLLAEVISVAGTYVTRLALPWFVLTATDSTSQMGAVLATQMAAMAIFGIPAGPLADRLTPRRTMQIADLARGALILLVPVLQAAHLLSFPVLLAIVFLVGSFFTPYHAAQRVLLPDLVRDDQQALSQANALLIGATRTASLLGPAVAGMLVATSGASTALIVDAATFFASYLLITFFVRGKQPSSAGNAPPTVFSGLILLVRDRVLRPWTIAQCVCEMAVQIVLAAVPIMAFLRYGGDPRTAGLLLMMFGAGAVAGNVLVLLLLPRWTTSRLIVAGCVLEPAILWVLAIDTRAVTVGVVLLLAGSALGLINGPGTAMQTHHTPPALRTHGMSAFATLILGSGALGLALTAPALETLSPEAVFTLVAMLYTIGSLFAIASTARSDGA